MPEIVLTTGPLGGLGDWMLYSTLPERFTQLGYDVYVDPDNLCRNPEISDLIFAHNPYIVGSSTKKPNAGHINQGKFYDIANKFPAGSIEMMERAHGLPPPYSLAPKVTGVGYDGREYYQPRPFLIDLSQSVLVDFSALSSKLGSEAISTTLNKMQERFPHRMFYMATFPEGVLSENPPMEGPSVRMNSIFEYVDALASCYAFVCSEAGSQSLAAAVRGEHDVHDMEARPEIVSVISLQTYNSRGYTYRGIDYRVTKDSSNSITEYWTPTEVAYERYALQCRRTVEEARAMYQAAKAAREVADAAHT